MCVREGGRITLSALVPAAGAQAFRSANPGASACPEGRAATAPRFDVNSLLDASGDGTFSGARRSSLLAHRDPAATMTAITRVANAAADQRIDLDVAGRLIADFAAPPLAAAQAGLAREVLTPAELAAQRAAQVRGLSDSEQLAGQTQRLNEACLPRVCFMSGNKVTGKADSINFVTITAEEAVKTPGFLRFCTRDDLAAAGAIPSSAGEWIIEKLRAPGVAVGLLAPTEPRALVVPLPPGAPPPPGPAPAPPPLNPGGLYLMWNPARNGTAMILGADVPARLAQGWALA